MFEFILHTYIFLVVSQCRMASTAETLSDADTDIIEEISIELEVMTVLPNITEAKLGQLKDFFKANGVTSTSDLYFLQASDLPMLSLVESRKLVHAWQGKFSAESSQSSKGTPSASTPGTPASSGRFPIKSWLESSLDSSLDSSLELESQLSVASPSGASTSGAGTNTRAKKLPVSESEDNIPWSKMPPKLMEALEAGQRPEPRLRREMIRIIVDNLNKPGSKLPRTKQLGLLARAIVEKYPKSFRDEVGGMDVGTGYDSFLKQLVNKVDNITRPNVNKRKLSAESDKDSVKAVDAYGCINWMPDFVGSEEAELNLKRQMQEQHKKGETDDVTVNMEQTFASQRKAINSTTFNIPAMLNDWPFLFTEKSMLGHFEQLTGVNVYSAMENAASLKVPKLMAFMADQIHNKQVSSCMKEINKATQEAEDKTPTVIGSVAILTSFYKEDFEAGIMDTQTLTSTSASTIETLELPATPCLVAHGASLASTLVKGPREVKRKARRQPFIHKSSNYVTN
ncbi:uncharacterized protein [Amphiura filiformis]|uniref:uncharacterized protein isoform X2 n=1 Tax=Amphiura filiformis TaxID=82378 RepID=UPI003B2285D0